VKILKDALKKDELANQREIKEKKAAVKRL